MVVSHVFLGHYKMIAQYADGNCVYNTLAGISLPETLHFSAWDPMSYTRTTREKSQLRLTVVGSGLQIYWKAAKLIAKSKL